MTRTPNTGSKRAKKQAENDEITQILLAMGTVDPNTFAAITGKGLSVYWRPSAWITGSDGLREFLSFAPLPVLRIARGTVSCGVHGVISLW